MKKLNDACKPEERQAFMECTPEQKHDLLVDLDKEQKAIPTRRRRKDRRIISDEKELTLWGYFTSERCDQRPCGMLRSGKYEAVSITRRERSLGDILRLTVARR